MEVFFLPGETIFSYLPVSQWFKMVNQPSALIIVEDKPGKLNEGKRKDAILMAKIGQMVTYWKILDLPFLVLETLASYALDKDRISETKDLLESTTLES